MCITSHPRVPARVSSWGGPDFLPLSPPPIFLHPRQRGDGTKRKKKKSKSARYWGGGKRRPKLVRQSAMVQEKESGRHGGKKKEKTAENLTTNWRWYNTKRNSSPSVPKIKKEKRKLRQSKLIQEATARFADFDIHSFRRELLREKLPNKKNKENIFHTKKPARAAGKEVVARTDKQGAMRHTANYSTAMLVLLHAVPARALEKTSHARHVFGRRTCVNSRGDRRDAFSSLEGTLPHTRDNGWHRL